MSNLQIAYNDIPKSAVLTTASSENASHPHQNIFYGGKGIFWETASVVTSSTITLDLGTGVTKSAEYLLCSGVHHILAQDYGSLTIQLRASTDNFSASDVLIVEKTSITTSDLLGSYDEEVILTTTASTAYRYWRIKIDTGNAVIHKLRKAYLGMFFDFSGRSPSYPYSFVASANVRNKSYSTDAGSLYLSSSGRAKRIYSFLYKGIPDNTREDFYNKLGDYNSDYPIFLYIPDTLSHRLFKNKILFGWFTSDYSSNDLWQDAGTLSIEILEDILG